MTKRQEDGKSIEVIMATVVGDVGKLAMVHSASLAEVKNLWQNTDPAIEPAGMLILPNDVTVDYVRDLLQVILRELRDHVVKPNGLQAEAEWTPAAPLDARPLFSETQKIQKITY